MTIAVAKPIDSRSKANLGFNRPFTLLVEVSGAARQLRECRNPGVSAQSCGHLVVKSLKLAYAGRLNFVLSRFFDRHTISKDLSG
jgi:hypothetical protein